MSEYDVPSASELDLEPPPDPRPSWIEVALLVVMQVGMSVVMHFMGRVFGSNDSMSSIGFFAIFIGSQLFGSYHARHYPGRLARWFGWRLVAWSAVVQVVLGAAFLLMAQSAGVLPADALVDPQGAPLVLTPTVVVVAAVLAGGALTTISWLGLKLGVLMVTRFEPPTRPMA